MPDLKAEKRLAAQASLEFVRDGMTIGLGSGSTAEIMIRQLGERVQRGLSVRGIATSRRSEEIAREVGIELTTLENVIEALDFIDVTIDGADRADADLNLIKGGGGALLREKVVAAASRMVVIIADSSKLVAQLSGFPLPIEVSPFGEPFVLHELKELGFRPIRRVGFDGWPFITDETHRILDCEYDDLADPKELSTRLDQMPGVMEHGLFVDIADVLLVARGEAVEKYERERKA